MTNWQAAVIAAVSTVGPVGNQSILPTVPFIKQRAKIILKILESENEE